MGKVHWIANAKPVAQVYTIQITGYDGTTTYKATINGKVISTLGVTDANGTAAALQALLAASVFPEFKEVTWTVSTDTVTGTAVTPGSPFTVTATVSGGSGTVSGTAVTASTGPNYYDNVANWDTGAIPIANDDVYFDEAVTPCLYGIDQNTITLTSLSIPASYTGTIGLPLWNANGYYEYRNRSLKISSTSINIGYGAGAKSGFIDLNTGTVQTTITALMGRQRGATPALLWTGSHASNIFQLLGGSAAGGYYAGGTCRATFDLAGDCTLFLGAGATINGWTQSDGSAEINSNVGTVTKNGGSLLVTNGGITTLNNYGGTVIYNSTGTLATGIIGSTGTLDFSQDLRTKTITNPLQAYSGATIIDPNHVALAIGVTPVGCKLTDLNLKLTYGKTWTPT